jgi:Tfp pilus assembly protein PilP
MTWKSTAIVTGATALVGWLASPLPHAPAVSVVAPRSQVTQVVPSSDIEHQAARLRARLRDEASFKEPSRDPFHFAARAAQSQPRSQASRLAEFNSAPAPVPQVPLVTLSGLATDVVDGTTQRTAILSAPDGVLLVHEGDSVVGLYRVGKIDDETVDLIRDVDGQLLRLRLANPRP